MCVYLVLGWKHIRAHMSYEEEDTCACILCWDGCTYVCMHTRLYVCSYPPAHILLLI